MAIVSIYLTFSYTINWCTFPYKTSPKYGTVSFSSIHALYTLLRTCEILHTLIFKRKAPPIPVSSCLISRVLTQVLTNPIAAAEKDAPPPSERGQSPGGGDAVISSHCAGFPSNELLLGGGCQGLPIASRAATCVLLTKIKWRKPEKKSVLADHEFIRFVEDKDVCHCCLMGFLSTSSFLIFDVIICLQIF